MAKVIHQPRIEVAQLFDELVLMTANPGRAVYNGKMEERVHRRCIVTMCEHRGGCVWRGNSRWVVGLPKEACHIFLSLGKMES